MLRDPVPGVDHCITWSGSPPLIANVALSRFLRPLENDLTPDLHSTLENDSWSSLNFTETFCVRTIYELWCVSFFSAIDLHFSDSDFSDVWRFKVWSVKYFMHRIYFTSTSNKDILCLFYVNYRHVICLLGSFVNSLFDTMYIWDKSNHQETISIEDQNGGVLESAHFNFPLFA